MNSFLDLMKFNQRISILQGRQENMGLTCLHDYWKEKPGFSFSPSLSYMAALLGKKIPTGQAACAGGGIGLKCNILFA